jgi:hypothetical protein
MTQHLDPTTSTRGHQRSFVSPGMIRRLAGFVLAVGVVAAVSGVAYAINGATHARGWVVVDVQVRPGAVLEVSGTTSAKAKETVLVEVDPFGDGLRLDLPGVPKSNWVEAAQPGTLKLSSWDSTVGENLLSRGGFAVSGLCIGVGAILLRRLLISIAEGRPFRPGNAARLAGMGGLLVLASLANDILPVLGSNLVLDRLGLGGSSSPIFAEVVPSLDALLGVPILLALAEAFRRGTELAQDVEGLV